MTKYVAICPKCEKFRVIPDFLSTFLCHHLKLSKFGFMAFYKETEATDCVPYENIVCKVLPIEEVNKGENHG